MLKNTVAILIAVFIILAASYFVFSEEITITTYYPSPFGNYRELRSQRMAIGEHYSNSTYCWGAAGACTNVINATTDLVVEERLGIGTIIPKNMLDVEGGVAIGATYSGTNTAPANGLIVEGNMSVGASAPGAGNRLDVQGRINAVQYAVAGVQGENRVLNMMSNGGTPCEITVSFGVITNSTCL